MIDALPMLISGIQLFDSAEGFSNDPELQSQINERQEYPLTERLAKENEYLGVYLSGHPVSQYQDLAIQVGAKTASQLQPGQNVVILMLVNRIKAIHTKKDHRQMAFLSGTDQTGEIEVTVFPRQYDRYQDALENNRVLVIYGHTEQREGHGLQIIAEQIQDADKLRQKRIGSRQRWFLRILSQKDNSQVLNQLYKFMEQHRGPVPVIIYYPENDQKMMQPRSRWLNNRNETLQGLIKILGKGNVVLQNLKS